LFGRDDKIAVAVSGGKDSTVCLYILKKLGYDVEAVTIDAAIGNYTKENLDNIKKFCKEKDIQLHVISFRDEFGKSLCYIRSVLNSKGYDYSSCMLCGILKRYLLNKYCRKGGFDYLATGHNLDDEAEAFLMNLFRNAFSLAMKQGPKSSYISDKFVRRVKPLYFITNEETTRYSKIMKFPVVYTPCPCSVDAHRKKFRRMLEEFSKENTGVKYSIINFQEMIKNNLKEMPKVEMEECSVCGEPSSGKVCKACQIFKELNIKRS
jgi:uncharacterized protein (TIGR00269 family)